ncbi:MAG TPA: DUF6651 domain-containing protein [Azonexus sp.]|nr:DUF6651 domain-containing protein [Azonexus sp.]
MKLKTITIDGKTYAEVDGDKPIYTDDAGKDVAFDAPGTVATISRLNSEAKGHREGKERAEGLLKTFEGVDPAAARDAMDKLSKIDAKKLVEAGDMDAAIAAAIKPYTEKLAAADKTIEELGDTLNKSLIGNGFSQSKFAAEKLTPAGVDLLRTMFADRMKVEGGQVVGYDTNGQKLYSKSRPGELASFDEVVEALVDTYPHKDHILKGVGGGSGAQHNNGGGSGGGKSKSLEEFNAMSPRDRAQFMAKGGAVADA